MIFKRFCLSACLSCVAVAAACTPVYAQEWIGTESESIGSFGIEDNSPSDNLGDLMENLENVGLDLSQPSTDPVLPSPESTLEPSPEVSPDVDQELIEDLFYNYIKDIEFSDSVKDSQSSSFDLDSDSLDVDPLANYDTYYGSIGSTYLEYFRGFLPKLGFREHYVASRTGQYTYIFAYGDLQYSGSLFSGHNIKVITFYTNNNGSYHIGTESSFNLDANNYMVYSDLSKDYPSLADTSGVSSRQILILLTIMGLVWTIDHMYQVRKIRRLN